MLISSLTSEAELLSIFTFMEDQIMWNVSVVETSQQNNNSFFQQKKYCEIPNFTPVQEALNQLTV